MKDIVSYILESLNSEFSNWIKQVYDVMTSLIKNKALKPIDINVDGLAKPKYSISYDDFYKDQTVRNIMKNKYIGFTVINQMISMPKKYMIDSEGNEIKPMCLPYWYRPINEAGKIDDEKIKNDKIEPTYFVGLIMYDENDLIENYLNIVGIETSMCVEKSLPVLKALLNDFSLHYILKLKNDYDGLCAKPIHPKMKAIMMKLGFKPSKDNKDILIYEL